jgi:hypothetical protein
MPVRSQPVRSQPVRSQPSLGVLTATIAGAAIALAGCSSDATLVAARPAKVDLTNTSWSGPCVGAGLGPYTFDFGAGNSDGGTVRVTFPDATTVRTAQYTLQSDDSGHTSFTFALNPAWKGSLQRDYKSLVMSAEVEGKPGGYHCSLVRNDTNGAKGANGRS